MVVEKDNQRSVSRTVWNWRCAEPGSSPVGPRTGLDPHGLRRAAVQQAAIKAVVGAILFLVVHHRVLALVVWGLAVVIALTAGIHPPAYRPLHRFGAWLGRTVGFLLIYVLLVPFFYLFFFPVAVILRLQKRDPMCRGLRPAHLTYWIPRRYESTPLDYERQFLREDKEARKVERPVGAVATPTEQRPS
jgi:hypothetical protein